MLTVTRENLEATQGRQTIVCYLWAWECLFEIGNWVLILLLNEVSKLMTQWQGLYEVIWKTGLVYYKVWQSGRTKIL